MEIKTVWDNWERLTASQECKLEDGLNNLDVVHKQTDFTEKS